MPLVAACSLLYNPNNLPGAAGEAGIDAFDPDAEIILDTNPDALVLESVEPSVLVEGQGVGGSSPTILVIHGRQLVNNTTTVSITAHDASGAIAEITVDNSKLDVSANGRDLAVPISFAIDAVKGKLTPRRRLDVTVSQMGATGLVTATLAMKAPGDSAVLELEYLDELTNASPEFAGLQLAPGTYRYSRVVITGGLKASSNAGPLRIESISSFSSTGVVNIKAVGGTPTAGGNGGGNGGGASTLGPANPGSSGAGDGAGKSSGGGGGFGSVGLGGPVGGPKTGDDALKDFTSNRSSGGGGGLGGVGIASTGGGVGGAGGGVIELTAGGDLSIGDLTAIGGDGAVVAATSNGGGGGGGSGGAVLLRARGSLTITSATATGGLAGGGGAVASHAGGEGRVRIDTPANVLAINSVPAAFRGPMLAADSNLIVRTETPTFIVTGAKNRSFSYFFVNSDGAQAGTPSLIGPSGTQSLTIPASKPLGRGINHFCLLVDGADAASPPEAMNCYDIVYLFRP